jgi:hypothetical protein
MLQIRLKKLGKIRGIYGVSKNVFPDRAAYMHPDAAAALMALEQATPLRYSDILRGADESLKACKSGRGAQPPGYSGHNFGLSVDIDVESILKERKWSYEKLVVFMAKYGFYPYRQDHSRGPEDWHFNFLGDQATATAILKRTAARHLWQTAAEEIIRHYYPAITPLGAVGIQTCLKKLGLYSGDIDGDLGPLSSTAIDLFNRTWDISPRATGERFQRTLAFVAAELVMEPG